MIFENIFDRGRHLDDHDIGVLDSLALLGRRLMRRVGIGQPADPSRDIQLPGDEIEKLEIGVRGQREWRILESHRSPEDGFRHIQPPQATDRIMEPASSERRDIDHGRRTPRPANNPFRTPVSE